MILLREAAAALWDELYAAGDEDVKAHPTLRKHARVHAKIIRFLGLPKERLP